MQYATNKTVRVDWLGRDDGRTLSTYDGGSTTSQLDDLDTLKILQYALEPRTERELISFLDDLAEDGPSAERRLERLLDDDLLLPSDHSLSEESAEWFEKHWRVALYYHFATRGVDPDAVRRPPEGLADDLLEPARSGVDGEVVSLPEPDPLPDRPVNEVMLGRRTHRSFRGNDLDATQLSTLLHHSFEKTRRLRSRVADPDEPSSHADLAAALPFDVYTVVMRNEDLDCGVYRYGVRDHELVRVRDLDSPEAVDDLMARTATDQDHLRGSAATMLFDARFDREQERYRHSRALRNVYVQTAVQGHRVILTAIAMGLRAFLTPALRDSLADDVVRADGFRASPTYLVSVGR